MGTMFSSTLAAPDYGSAESWWCNTANDGGNNAAAWTPDYATSSGTAPPAVFTNIQGSHTDCDTFYVHPTTALTHMGFWGTG